MMEVLDTAKTAIVSEIPWNGLKTSGYIFHMYEHVGFFVEILFYNPYIQLSCPGSVLSCLILLHWSSKA